MSEPKFTPGPWSYHSDYIWSWKSLDKGGNPRPIAGPANSPSEHEENKANANLLAAAPELYEALERIVENNNTISVIQYDDRLRARAALAKARGEG